MSKAFNAAFHRVIHRFWPRRWDRGPDGEVDAFQGGVLVGEMAAGADRAADAGVDRLDRVRGADDAADLGVEGQEQGELGPRVLPKTHDRRIFRAPDLAEFVESFQRGCLGGCGVDRFERLGDRGPVLAPGGIAIAAGRVHSDSLTRHQSSEWPEPTCRAWTWCTASTKPPKRYPSRVVIRTRAACRVDTARRVAGRDLPGRSLFGGSQLLSDADERVIVEADPVQWEFFRAAARI